MGKNNIIKKFLSVGVQLSKDALDYFTINEKDIDVFIERFGKIKERPEIVTLSTVQRVLSTPDGFSISVKATSLVAEGEKVSIRSLVNDLTNKYNLLKHILEGKNGLSKLISINKISQNTKEFSIICMVNDVNRNSVTVEDTTGELTLHFDDIKDTILPDDVIGLICEQKEGRFLIKNIVWPDIPLKREVKKSKKKINCIFLGTEVSEIYIENGEAILFAFGSPRKLNLNNIKITEHIFLDENMKGKKKSVFKPPIIVELNGVNIVILSTNLIQKYKKYWKKEGDIIKNLLKRRDIDPIQDITGQRYTSSVLESPPDIVVVADEGTKSLNYKGTTMLSVSKNSGYYIDLNTREVKKI